MIFFRKKYTSFKIKGKKWKLFRKPLVKDWGYCYKQKRKIVIDPTAANKKELEIIIHEVTHGSFWDLSEESVAQFGEDLSNLLWKLGYRKHETH